MDIGEIEVDAHRFYHSPTSPSLPPLSAGFLFLLQRRVSTVILVVPPLRYLGTATMPLPVLVAQWQMR